MACDSAPADGRLFGQLRLTLGQARRRWPWGSSASTVVRNRIRFAASLFRAAAFRPTSSRSPAPSPDDVFTRIRGKSHPLATQFRVADGPLVRCCDADGPVAALSTF
jgi:hypothetical protein